MPPPAAAGRADRPFDGGHAARGTAGAQPTPPRRGRLTPEREQELYEAVLGLLREVGYEALTMDAVAARARTSKATLYRQWQGKPELVASALRYSRPVHVADVDTGTLRGDLQELARNICRHVEEDAALLRGMGHAAHTNPEFQRALRELLIQPEIDGFQVKLAEAVRRGEIDAANPALEFVPHLLVGGLFSRQLVEDRDTDAAYMTRYLEAVVFPVLGLD